MALTVEDGTGLAAADSYVSTARADALAIEMGLTDWATVVDKEAPLRQATSWIDGHYTWPGRVKNLTQALDWPRVGAIDDEERRVASDAVPLKVERATTFLAAQAATARLDVVVAGAPITRKTVGPITTEWGEGGTTGARSYAETDTLLAGLYRGGTTGAITFAEIIR